MNLLDHLEKEAIGLIRDVVYSNNPSNIVLLYSMGKDSSVLLHLCEKAFSPQKIPFTLLHIDTGYKFPEMYEFRSRIGEKYKLESYIHPARLNPWEHKERYTDVMKTEALKTALKEGGYQFAFCGARRDEEKSRAKEHVISLRNQLGQWEPRDQNPEFLNLVNPLVHEEKTARVFPLSNWTELDVWKYIKRENIKVLPLYYTHIREVKDVGGKWITDCQGKGEKRHVRFRTLGCWPLTAAVEENAANVDEIIQCLLMGNVSERVTRLIDYEQESSMEKRKQNGYF